MNDEQKFKLALYKVKTFGAIFKDYALGLAKTESERQRVIDILDKRDATRRLKQK